MIDHEEARRLSATALDFDLEPAERDDLDAHVRSCAACRQFSADLASDAAALRGLDLGPVRIDVRARLAIATEQRGRRRSGPVLLAAAVLLAIAVFGGIAAGVGGRPGDGPSDVVPAVGRAVHWTTPVVDLAADDLWLEVAGRTVAPPPDRELTLQSDPGTPTYWTLEVTWQQGPVEQRINLYFAADGSEWRIEGARIYDGRVPGDWLESSGVVARAPLGTVFSGDLDIAMTDASGPNTGPGRLVMRGLRLSTRASGALGPVVEPTPGSIVSPLDPSAKVDCGPLAADACATVLDRVIGDARRTKPDRHGVSFVVDAAGFYTLTLDDGTAIGGDISPP